ncbi:hypothetical protein ACQ1ZF_14655, partial [Enterococcus faecalis]|uniref:hypothetical protein n=1 Tax=Enterococcus faecalis TaxID=1351 RepID=UPI003D6B6943
ASGDSTARGKVFDTIRGYDWPGPWNIRTLVNDFSRRWESDREGLQRDLDQQKASYAAARDAGDVSVAAVIAGEAVDLIH